ncbi:MAG: class I SAM-dependent RNA methyltransferase [Rhodobacter sp.]|nr:class I SAM-dependent RNA methyltransferase [Rhodobacter sp.]
MREPLPALKIERLGRHGDGIAAGPVYAPLALPGELVEGDVTGDRMVQPRILRPSINRVRPPCRHFKSCGGCALQHASDAFLETWKADLVRRALAAQGIEAPISGVATSPPQSRRRAVFSGRRTKKGALVGFHARASDLIVEVPDCQLVLPEIAACLPALRELTILGATRKAEVTLTVTWSDAGADVAVDGGKEPDGRLQADLAGLATRFDFARLAWNGEPVVERRRPGQRFDGIPLTPPPGAFLQATQHGETRLQALVRRAVGDVRRAADLFAGCGTFALPLARNAEVHAVEGDAAMLAALDEAWRHAEGLKRITTEPCDLFRRPLLAAELAGYQAVVIDPPRAGAEAQMAEIACAQVPRIAAVSCNPSNFARDARILVDAGYRLDWIEVVDQFRWSAHVELAAQFTLAHIRDTGR